LENNEKAEGKFERRGGKKDYFQNQQQGTTGSTEKVKTGPMEVLVDTNIEKAMKILKRKLIKEGLFKELKARRYFEKPSLKRKRKAKESLKKSRKDEARSKKNSSLFS
jgi:small subunit ribosomal protein S21